MMKRNPKSKAARALADASTRMQELAGTLTPKQWQARVKQLAESITERETRLKRTDAHAAIQELLPLYASEEQDGKPVRRTFPRIAQHLAHCTRCRTVYELISAGLASNRPAMQTVAPLPRTTRRTRALPAAWKQVVLPIKGSAYSRYQFQLNPKHIRNRWMHAPGLRNTAPETEALIVNDQISLDNRSILVQAWLAPSSTQNETFELRLVLSGATSPVRRFRAFLDWGERHYESGLKRGQAHFGQLALVSPRAAFSITLEPITDERPPRAKKTRSPKLTRRTPPR